MPLALTDDQLATVHRTAAPLAPANRVAFMQAVASELSHCNELGDGVIARTCYALQRQYFDPPDLGRANDWSRWR